MMWNASHTWVCVAPLTRLALFLAKLMSTVASKWVCGGAAGAAPTGPPPPPMLALIFAAMAAAAWMAARFGLNAIFLNTRPTSSSQVMKNFQKWASPLEKKVCRI